MEVRPSNEGGERTVKNETIYLRAGSCLSAPSVLIEIAGESNFKLRRRVAYNPASPQTLLRALSRDNDKEVRRAVALNPSTPDRVRDELAHDWSPDVRFAVAESDQTPPAILHELMLDGNPYVVRRASQSLERRAVNRS